MSSAALASAQEATDKALSQITEMALRDLRTLANPPEIIIRVFDVLLVLLGRPTGWENGKQLLGAPDLAQQLKSYDVRGAPAEAIADATDRLSGFTAMDVRKAAAVGGYLYEWAHSTLQVRAALAAAPATATASDDSKKDNDNDDNAPATAASAKPMKPSEAKSGSAAPPPPPPETDVQRAEAAAAEALAEVKPMSLRDLRMLPSPPATIGRVFDVLLVLLGQPTGWDNGKKLLGAADFIDQLKNYDVRAAPAEAITDAAARLEGFTEMDARKVAAVAGSLYGWARSIVNLRRALDASEKHKAD